MSKGLQFDRRWMLVDEAGTFMTQRVLPKMALFKLSINDDRISIRYQPVGASVFESIVLDTTRPADGGNIGATIWNDAVDTIEVDPKISKWFSEKLEMTCRLVVFPEPNARLVEKEYRLDHEHVSLADAYPFLIIGQSSLDDLNNRLEQQVGINRFRPNFVFTGGSPYEEDQWKDFAIGDIKFIGVKPCARCVLTTVDQETATKGTEPLATLSKYRRKENKVLFGQNVLPIGDTGGYVYEGDRIMLTEVISKR